MPSYTTLNVKIQRDSNSIPWGFRMQGGREFGCPLQIQRVNPDSLAERCGIRAEDYILRIGQASTEFFRHEDAQEHIKQQNNTLVLVLQRGASPSSADYNGYSNYPAYQPVKPRQPEFVPPPHQVLNAPIAIPVTNNRVLLNQSYNTPIGLYSADSIAETIQHTLQSVSVGSDGNNAGFKSDLQATTAKAMPKPPHHDPVPHQLPPAPHIPPARPVGVSPSNLNTKNAPTFGIRVYKKGAKGSALLNLNDNSLHVATCFACEIHIRGPFITAIDRCYCVDHFTCAHCCVNLMDHGFVEEDGKLYCEHDFEQYLAPFCVRCNQKILKECIHALEKTWHPECFVCTACKKVLGTGSFHVEEGHPYCVEDYRRMFQIKCTSCDFAIEPGDKYLEALSGTYHADCFTCSLCQVSLDGQPFVVKNNRPYCRKHGQTKHALFN